jgi:hypothetical protein
MDDIGEMLSCGAVLRADNTADGCFVSEFPRCVARLLLLFAARAADPSGIDGSGRWLHRGRDAPEPSGADLCFHVVPAGGRLGYPRGVLLQPFGQRRPERAELHQDPPAGTAGLGDSRVDPPGAAGTRGRDFP